MLPYLLHLLLLTEILLSKSQTVKLFTPDTSFSNTLECISKQVCFFKICWCGSLYWICYNIVSALWFGFLAPRHVGSQLPNQGSTHTSCIRKWSLNHRTTRKVPPSSFEALLSLDSQTVLSEGVITILILVKQTRQKMWLEGKWLGVEHRPTDCQLRVPISATRKGLSHRAVLF